MPLIDLHSDILVDVVPRRSRGERRVIAERHLPSLRAAGISALGLTIWVELDETHRAVARTREVLEALAAELRESPDELALVRTPDEAEAAMEAGRLAILVTIEGMAALDEDRALWSDLCTQGLTSGMLTWNEANAFASGFPGYDFSEARALASAGKGSWLLGLQGPGTGDVKGLTAEGRVLLCQMADAGVMLDLSHLNVQCFWDAVEAYPGPGVMASHSNAHVLCPISRNLSDDQIKEIASRDGVIGMNAYPDFVHPECPGLDRYIDHAVYIADLVGTRHLGFGFDFTDYLDTDALYGGRLPSTPQLRGAPDVACLLARMEERGFATADIEAMAWGNFARVWRSAATYATTKQTNL